MHPFPPPVKIWWPLTGFDWSLLSVHWPVGILVMRSGFWFRVLSKKIGMPGCQIACHYLIWSSLVCWTCKQCSSTRSFVLFPLWLLPEPLLLPTFLKNQLPQVKILFVFYLKAKGPLCRSSIAQMAMERLWLSSFLLGFSGRSHTFDTCHTSWQSPSLLFALLAKSVLLW